MKYCMLIFARGVVLSSAFQCLFVVVELVKGMSTVCFYIFQYICIYIIYIIILYVHHECICTFCKHWIDYQTINIHINMYSINIHIV